MTTMTTMTILHVEAIPLKEYVRRKPDAATTFICGGYDRATKRYSLIDTEDLNREVWVKRGTLLHVGFAY